MYWMSLICDDNRISYLGLTLSLLRMDVRNLRCISNDCNCEWEALAAEKRERKQLARKANESEGQ